MIAIVHASVFLLAVGFFVFFYMIYRGLRKMVKRARKIRRREKAARIKAP